LYSTNPKKVPRSPIAHVVEDESTSLRDPNVRQQAGTGGPLSNWTIRMGSCAMREQQRRQDPLRQCTMMVRVLALKTFLKHFARQSGLYVASTSRLGIDVELDLARLSSTAPLKTIFDVGANFGQTACRFAKAFPLAEMICSFEPVPTSFMRLQEAVKSLPQVRTFNCALGDSPGTVQINVAPSAGSNSIKAIKAATGNVAVSIDTLDNVCDSNQIESVDLLKIDVEGFELPVLRGAIRRLSNGNIRYIYAECVFAPNAEMPPPVSSIYTTS
jgi:FkbM family methyltransferase